MKQISNEDEQIGLKEKAIAKIITITLFSITIVVIISILVFKHSYNKIIEGLSKNTYYVLDVDEDNVEKVISLIQEEKQSYCESLYKIEYYNMFPDSTSYLLYCEDEDNIKFSIDKVGTDVLSQYIYDNGTREVR